MHAHYTSTACYHGAHTRCRRRCKFCLKPCVCSCHQPRKENVMTEPMPENKTEDPRTIDPAHGAGSGGAADQGDPNEPEPQGDPDALDTGDLLEVPVEERTDVDDDPANADAGEDLSDVPEGEVVDVTEPEDDDPEGERAYPEDGGDATAPADRED